MNEGNGEFYLEIEKTSHCPHTWGGVRVNVFNPWHEDKIFNCLMTSDFIWIRVNSIMGIGSITFIPEYIDPIYKDFIIFHDYVPKPTFKPVIGVFVYPNSTQRVKDVRTHLESLRSTNMDVYIISNMRCESEFGDLCDGFIYSGENEMVRVPDGLGYDKLTYLKKAISRPVTLFDLDMTFYNSHQFINGSGTYLWAIAKSLSFGFNELYKRGYTHIMVSEGEFELDKKDSDKPLRILKNLYNNDIALDFFYTENSCYLQAYLWFGELEHIVRSFRGVSKYDKINPHSGYMSDSNAFAISELYNMHKLLSSTDRKVIVRTNVRNKSNIEEKYWYNTHTEVQYYEDSDFTYSDGEALSFGLYFPNTTQYFLFIQDKIEIVELSKDSFDFEVVEKNSQLVCIVNNKASGQAICIEVDFIKDGEVIYSDKLDAEHNCFYYLYTPIYGNIDRCDYRAFSDKIIFYEGFFLYEND